MTRGNRWLGGVLLTGLLAACETDHSALELKPSGAGGAGAGGSAGSSGAPTQIMGGADGQAGGHADDEPAGSNVFTIVNGVVDAPSVVLCWAKVSASGGSVPFGSPLTEAPFEYAKTLSLKSVAGAALDTDILQPIIIAGELDLVAGLGCEDAVARAQDEEAASINANAHSLDIGQAGANDGGANDAGASPGGGGAGGISSGGSGGGPALRSRLRLRALPSIPAGTLSAGRSILYVATGCMGGATYDATNSAEYCGDGYTGATPTLSGVLVSLSRRTLFGEAGMQFVHASLASPLVDVSSRPPFPSSDTGISLVSGVRVGQLAPHSALLVHPASELGVTRLYNVAILGGGTVLTAEPWTAVLARGGLKSLMDGVTYAIVLVGPRADHITPTKLWNPSAITVIPVEGP